MSEPAIAVLPYGMSLGPAAARLPLNTLHWPSGLPVQLAEGTLSDLGPEDHLIVYPKTKLHLQPSFGTRAQISLIMGEPSVIHAKHIAMLRLSHRRFFRILTFNEALIARLPNAQFFPYGTTWVPHWRSLDTSKHKSMSLIASAKRDTEGHKLRHTLVDRVRAAGLDVEVLGRGYQPFEDKAEGLAPYRFSIVVENMRERNYFSEKLIDAVLCDTVPIYWGCPNLVDFMDTSGIIVCETAEDMWAAIASADETLYTEKLPRLQAARPALEKYCDLEARAVDIIRSTL